MTSADLFPWYLKLAKPGARCERRWSWVNEDEWCLLKMRKFDRNGIKLYNNGWKEARNGYIPSVFKFVLQVLGSKLCQVLESRALIELRRLALADLWVRSCGRRYCDCSSELDVRDRSCCQNEEILKATVAKLIEWAAKAMSWQPLVSIEQGYLHGLALAHFWDRRQHWRNRRPKSRIHSPGKKLRNESRKLGCTVLELVPRPWSAKHAHPYS